MKSEQFSNFFIIKNIKWSLHVYGSEANFANLIIFLKIAARFLKQLFFWTYNKNGSILTRLQGPKLMLIARISWTTFVTRSNPGRDLQNIRILNLSFLTSHSLCKAIGTALGFINSRLLLQSKRLWLETVQSEFWKIGTTLLNSTSKY